MASFVTAADICWGTSKKTNRRCANKAKVAQPGYLPTCHQHRDQLLRPGTCQYLVDVRTGARCKRRFIYDPPPPYFELCPDHVNTPQGPCYFLKLPVELRMEIYKYFLQPGAVVSNRPNAIPPEKLRDYLPLLFVNKQIASEARDHLYACTTFHIEVGQLGATIRNRYLYRPRGAEESSHNDPDRDITTALDIRQQLDFSRVKNFNLEVIVVNSSGLDGWSEEVEMYDLRDSISAILPYLARAQNLHKLTVRVVCARFDRWSPAKALANFKLITQPLMSLRNITRPFLEPPYKGEPLYTCWGTSPAKFASRSNSNSSITTTSYSAPCDLSPVAVAAPLPPPWTCDLTSTLIPAQQHPIHADFLAYKSAFEALTTSAEPIPPKPPVARMFSAFKRVYLECASLLLSSTTTTTNPAETLPSGAANYLHRARVARENADLDAFVAARNGFVRRWNAHVEQRYRELARVNGLVMDMYDADAVEVGAWDPRFAFLGPGGGGGGGGGGMSCQPPPPPPPPQLLQQRQRQLVSPPAENVAVGLCSPSLDMAGCGGPGGRVAAEPHGGPWVGGWDWSGYPGGGGGGGGADGDRTALGCDTDMALALKEEEGTGYDEGSLFACGSR